MVENKKLGKYTFDFDEQGTYQVSEQIMNSYNSGVIDQGYAQTGGNLDLGSGSVDNGNFS